MNYTLKMLIPIGLGITAAVVNYMAMSQHAETVRFVRMADDLSTGQRFDVRMLEPVELPVQFAALKDTAVPWDDRGVLVLQPAQRKLSRGDLVFWRDGPFSGRGFDLRDGEDVMLVSVGGIDLDPSLLQVGNEVSFRVPTLASATPTSGASAWIGPFRIVSVGAVITREIEKGDQVGNANSLGVAVSRNPTGTEAARIKTLEAFNDQQRMGLARLLGMRLHKPEKEKN